MSSLDLTREDPADHGVPVGGKQDAHPALQAPLDGMEYGDVLTLPADEILLGATLVAPYGVAVHGGVVRLGEGVDVDVRGTPEDS